MFVISTGMACSVGLTSAAACAAMRAGIAMFEELPYRDNHGEPIIGALVPGLNPDLKRSERLIELLAMALTDCLSKHPDLKTEFVPVLIGLAEPGRPGGCANLADSIVGAVEDKLGIKFHRRCSRGIAKGHTACFEGLRLAREMFTARDAEISTSLVCGVDSYINARSLSWLDQHRRLKRGGNSDGVIPGEAAAAVLVQHEPPRRSEVTVEITGLGFDHEKATVLSEEPLLGLGLTGAARTALAEARTQFHEIAFRLTDVTGEAYCFKEQSLVECRLMRVHRGEGVIPLWHCAESIGDTGAAAGACHLSLAHEAFVTHFAPGEQTICYGCAVGGDRSAAVIQRKPRSS